MTDLFVAFELLACRRVIKLTNTRIAVDFTHFLRELMYVRYNHREKIVLVMDHLNIHSIASLYKTFNPTKARQRLSQSLDFPLAMPRRTERFCGGLVRQTTQFTC